MEPSATGRFGGMQINTPSRTIHKVEKTLQNTPNHPRLKDRGGKMLRPRTSKMLCGTVYEIFRKRTAEVIIELKAVVDAR